jgi:hypothetical protein
MVPGANVLYCNPTANRLADLLQCKVPLLMWWTAPAPDSEVP